MSHPSRRDFLLTGTSCLAHVAFMAAGSSALARGLRGAPAPSRRAWPGGLQERPVVAREPWGRLEQVAEGVWALVSTPLEDRTTLCNGGIVAGRSGVLVVETFASDEGAAWMAGEATRLTGRPPTHVVLTHYHGDHSGGLTGFGDPAPDLRLTATTRDLVSGTDASREGGAPPGRARALSEATRLGSTAETAVDLGGMRVRIVPRHGHTASDVTVELDDPSVVFCGDLVWNEMFPNYVDAQPSALSASVRALRRDAPTVYVPGHGPVADRQALDTYIEVLDSVEEAARRAVDAGVPAAEAAASFTLPTSVGEWFLFNPAYFERALGAWERELTAG